MHYNKISVTEIEKQLNSLNMNNYEIFREYEKDHNKFLATDNIFVSDNTNNAENKKYIKICGNNNEKFIEKNNNLYIIHYDICYNEKYINKETKEINLLIIKNIDLELNTDLIDIKELLKDNNMNNCECDDLLQDLSVECYTIKYNVYLILSYISLIVYGLIVPLIAFNLIRIKKILVKEKS